MKSTADLWYCRDRLYLDQVYVKVLKKKPYDGEIEISFFSEVVERKVADKDAFLSQSAVDDALPRGGDAAP